MTKPEIIVCRDAAALARQGAEQFIACAGEAVARAGWFVVALSGGSTPAALYSLLAAEFRDRIDWPRVHLFWGDERCVAPDHPDSNFRMTQEALLRKIRIPPENVHRMNGEISPASAAREYEAELRRFFGLREDGWPRFDLIYLGLGEDGHTASLFPGSGAVEESKRFVAAVYVESLKSYRLTITVPVINAAAQVTFLASGKSKAKIVRKILADHVTAAKYPAAKVRPATGRLTWMLDAEAAKDLPPE